MLDQRDRSHVFFISARHYPNRRMAIVGGVSSVSTCCTSWPTTMRQMICPASLNIQWYTFHARSSRESSSSTGKMERAAFWMG